MYLSIHNTGSNIYEAEILQETEKIHQHREDELYLINWNIMPIMKQNTEDRTLTHLPVLPPHASSTIIRLSVFFHYHEFGDQQEDHEPAIPTGLFIVMLCQELHMGKLINHKTNLRK
jgi:hypothetical protein